MSTDVKVDDSIVHARIKAQERLCATERLPHFAPYNGQCWSCGRQIYTVLDGTSHVTGCPFCHRSYCD